MKNHAAETKSRAENAQSLPKKLILYEGLHHRTEHYKQNLDT